MDQVMNEQTLSDLPTLFEWMGGREALRNLMETFHPKILKDPLLAEMFREVPDFHPEHLAMWFEEVLGGEPRYTNERGGFKTMIGMHRGRAIQPEQRKRWVELLMETADEVACPAILNSVRLLPPMSSSARAARRPTPSPMRRPRGARPCCAGAGARPSQVRLERAHCRREPRGSGKGWTRANAMVMK